MSELAAAHAELAAAARAMRGSDSLPSQAHTRISYGQACLASALARITPLPASPAQDLGKPS